MKRSDKLTTFIGFLLFLALLAYIGAYAYRALHDTIVTAEAVSAQFDIGGTAGGIILRNETVLTADVPYVDVSASDGAKVAKGSLLATAMHSDTGKEVAGRMHELELEISRVSAALREQAGADDLTRRDEALQNGVASLCSAIVRHDLDTLDSASLNLSSLLFPADEDSASQWKLEQLQVELSTLQNSTAGDTTALYAEAAGTFSSVVDGYEIYSLSDVQDLTPSGLAELMASPGDAPAGAYGKLVEGYDWYFVSVMDAADAAKLTVGRRATLNFGRWYSSDISAKVLSISSSEDGSVVVIFRCATALADTLTVREATANVVFESYSGIRVPAQAVRTDPETESTFVWCVTATQLERKKLDIIYCDEDFVIAAPGGDADTLRAGNTVVVSGTDLYEGKIVE